MPNPSDENKVIATFLEPSYAERAADAARKAGFKVERRADGAVIVYPGEHPQHRGEVEGILRAYGAREYSSSAQGASSASAARTPERIRAEQGASVELIEEQLSASTRPVQTGEVTIRKEVVTETRTIEVPVRREELVIERHAIDRRPVDSPTRATPDPLVDQLVERLRHMQSGEMLRIPIIEEEVVVHKRPVVVEEITLGKRTIQETQEVSETIRREEARIEEGGDVKLRRQNT